MGTNDIYGIETNKFVSITVKYKEDFGVINVNGKELRNGQSQSVEYGSTVYVEIIPNDGYSGGISSLKMTPNRNISGLSCSDISKYNTHPMIFAYENFVEDMIFDYTFFRLYTANIEISDEGINKETNMVWIDGRSVYLGDKQVRLRSVKGLEMKFSYIDGFYLKHVFIDGTDRINEVVDGDEKKVLRLSDPPQNIKVEYGRKDGYCSITYDDGGTGALLYVNDGIISAPLLVPSFSQHVKISFYHQSSYLVLSKCLLNGIDVLGQVKNRELILSEVSEDLFFQFAFGGNPPSCRLSYNEGGIVNVNNMSVKSGSSISVSSGIDVKISILPQDGFHIKSVKVNSDGWKDFTDQIKNNILIIPAVSKNKQIQIEVKFAPNTYTVQVSHNKGGYVRVNGENITEENNTLSFDALTDIDVEIKSYSTHYVKQVKLGEEDVTSQLKNDRLKIPSILSDKKLSVVFDKLYTIKVNSSEGGRILLKNSEGSVTGLSSAKFKAFTDVQVMIEPNEKYCLKQLLLGTTDITNQVQDNKFIISSISEDKEITVIFEIDTSILYAVKAIYNEGGRIKINDQSVSSGNSISVNAMSDAKVSLIPNKGYHLKSIKLGNTNVTNQVKDNFFTIPAISTNKEITVTFEKDVYTVKAIYSKGGSVRLNDQYVASEKSILIDALTDVKVSIIPNNGYHLKQIKVGLTDVTDQVVNSLLTIPVILENKEITVIFEKNAPTSYTFRVNVSGNGNVKVDDKTIENESSVIVPITGTKLEFLPDNQYRVAKVLLGSKDITKDIVDNVYQVTSVSSDTSLTVTFERFLVNLSIYMDGIGLGKVQVGDQIISKTEEYHRESKTLSELKIGSKIDLNFLQDDYFEIKKASLNDVDITTQAREGRYQIQSLDSDLKLSIEYQRKSFKLTLGEFQGLDHIIVTYTRYEEPTQIELKSGTKLVEVYSNNLYYIKQVLLSGEKVFDCNGENTSVARFSIDMNADKELKVILVLRKERKLSLIVTEPGTLGTLLSDYEKKYVTSLSLHGSIDQRDFEVMNQMESLKHLTIGWGDEFETCIVAYENCPANTIPDNAFLNNKVLNTIEFGYSVSIDAIGNSAFSGCTALLSYSGDAKKLGKAVFKDCKKLTYIELKNVTELGEGVFDGCITMDGIRFYSNVKHIPVNAFRNCTSLVYVHFYGTNLESIGNNAFTGCEKLVTLWLDSKNMPEKVSSNSFDEYHYNSVSLFLHNNKADNYYLYKHHPVWSKFKDIDYWGLQSNKKIEGIVSEGGRVFVNNETYHTVYFRGDYYRKYPIYSYTEFIVEPDKKYTIESVVLEGKTITNTLDENNKFVIPCLKNDVLFEVKFKKENNPTDIEHIKSGKRVYRSAPKCLAISGFEAGVPVYVYDGNGRLVVLKTIRDNVEKVEVPANGLYFVRIGKESFKVIL